jgi:hypothetical protein
MSCHLTRCHCSKLASWEALQKPNFIFQYFNKALLLKGTLPAEPLPDTFTRIGDGGSFLWCATGRRMSCLVIFSRSTWMQLITSRSMFLFSMDTQFQRKILLVKSEQAKYYTVFKSVMIIHVRLLLFVSLSYFIRQEVAYSKSENKSII